MTRIDPSRIKVTGATMSGMGLCRECEHETVRHGAEAGGCVECRCRIEYGALARASAMVAGDPEWFAVTSWPRPKTEAAR